MGYITAFSLGSASVISVLFLFGVISVFFGSVFMIIQLFQIIAEIITDLLLIFIGLFP
jgi:hypothetical protein